MGSVAKRSTVFRVRLSAAALLCAATGGCLGLPDLDKVAAVPPNATPRAAAIAEMRAEAAAGDRMPYPDAFQSEQTTRLAAREEPLSTAEVEAIQAELALITERRAATSDAREIAALEARAKELRRLVLRSGAEPVSQ
jgi:hypothetical protein